MKKSLRFLLTLAMIAALVLSISATAFAMFYTVPTDVYLSKELYVQEGTTVPDLTIGFTAEAITEGAVDAFFQDVEITDADLGQAVNGVRRCVKLSNLSFSQMFPHAGIYEYKVTEKAAPESTENDKYYYSGAKYRMVVYVENIDTPTGSDLVIKEILVYNDKDEKMDTSDKKNDDGEYTNSFRFINNYQHWVTPVTDKTEGALVITKEVKGNLGDKTKNFDFTLTVNKPAGENVPDTFKYILNGLEKEGSYDTVISFQLAHKGRLVVPVLMTGTTYKVTEAQAENYETTVNGSEALVSVGSIGEKGVSAAYVNDYTGVIPEGVVIDNLPFFALISAAAAGLLIILFINKRRHSEG